MRTVSTALCSPSNKCCFVQAFESATELASLACTCVYALQPSSDWNLAAELLSAAEGALQAGSAPKAAKRELNHVRPACS